MVSDFGLDGVWAAFVACAGGGVLALAAAVAVVVGLSALVRVLGGASGGAGRARNPLPKPATRRAGRPAEVC